MKKYAIDNYYNNLESTLFDSSKNNSLEVIKKCFQREIVI